MQAHQSTIQPRLLSVCLPNKQHHYNTALPHDATRLLIATCERKHHLQVQRLGRSIWTSFSTDHTASLQSRSPQSFSIRSRSRVSGVTLCSEPYLSRSPPFFLPSLWSTCRISAGLSRRSRRRPFFGLPSPLRPINLTLKLNNIYLCFRSQAFPPALIISNLNNNFCSHDWTMCFIFLLESVLS
jgi:hypothetical protein